MVRGALWVVPGVVASFAAATVWLGTGAHWLTKQREVRIERRELGADDPLRGTGFYEGDVEERSVVRETFRFGLLPSGGGSHLWSVATVAGGGWLVSGAWLGWSVVRGRSGGRESGASFDRAGGGG